MDVDVINPVDVADTIGRFLAERCRTTIDDPDFVSRRRWYERFPVDFSVDAAASYNTAFSAAEFDLALRSLRDVAAGPDGVHNLMLRRLPPLALAKLLDVFNCLLLGRRFPEEWRRAIVVPVLKPSKTGASPSDYWPISLTSSFSKLFERMVCRQLSWKLEQNRLFNPIQCEFRQGRSTIDHLVTLDSCVRASFIRGHHVGVIFLTSTGI